MVETPFASTHIGSRIGGSRIGFRNLGIHLGWVVCLPLLLLVSGCGFAHPAGEEAQELRVAQSQGKATIGALASVVETQSELPFLARVDTGATYCSIHFEEIEIENEAEEMTANIGKQIRIKLKNELDDESWIETLIADCYTVRTSEKEEQRYRVSMEFLCQDAKREVLVTLNDRSHMNYPLLLGRNFLQGQFLVDIDLPYQSQLPNQQ